MTTTPCTEFEEVVQRVLDGELQLHALEMAHVSACADCCGLATAARVLAAMPAKTFAAPAEQLSERITTSATRDYRSRRRWRLAGRAVAAALAASVLIAGFVYLRPTEPTPIVKAPPPEPTPAPRVADRFADAGEAIASITRKATDQTVAPTRQLLPTPAFPTELPGTEPGTEALASVPSSAKAGFEPIASTTRRAMNLFMRDTGLATQPKPKL